MKKRSIFLTVLCLCLLLSGGVLPVRAEPGGPDDPLVSHSYIRLTFLPQVREALSGVVAALNVSHDGEAGTAEDGTAIFHVPAGQSLSLGPGQQFVLLSGDMSATVSGDVCDVTRGGLISGGAVRLYCRHIVCEDSEVYLDARESSVLKATASAVLLAGSPFEDVLREDWFYADVTAACRRGLVDGMTDTRFEPNGTLTGAQCVKLAACMRQLWEDGAVTLSNSGSGPWYQSYVDYALENGILERELDEYDRPISRGGFLEIFYRALPESAYAEINQIPDGAIPDVEADSALGAKVYAFYRAGILTGYTAYSFGADSEITRAEMATIMNRMFDSSARQRFSIP